MVLRAMVGIGIYNRVRVTELGFELGSVRVNFSFDKFSYLVRESYVGLMPDN